MSPTFVPLYLHRYSLAAGWALCRWGATGLAPFGPHRFAPEDRVLHQRGCTAGSARPAIAGARWLRDMTDADSKSVRLHIRARPALPALPGGVVLPREPACCRETAR